MTAALLDRMGAVAFDLDGTLVDTVPDLAGATNATLAEAGVPPLPDAAVAAMVGDGVEALVARALAAAGVSAGDTTLADRIARFRMHYAGALYVRSTVYPGVTSMLARLTARGLPLACVTNKPSVFALPLLAAAGLAPHLDTALCADRPEQRKPRPDLLLAAAAHFGIAPAALLYVGDSDVDATAAHAAGCPFVAVEYGYGRARTADGHRIARAGELFALCDAARVA